MIRRSVVWATLVVAAAAAAIALNLALLGSATGARDHVGNQSARTTWPQRLRPSRGIEHPRIDHRGRGSEADD